MQLAAREKRAKAPLHLRPRKPRQDLLGLRNQSCRAYRQTRPQQMLTAKDHQNVNRRANQLSS